MLAAPAGNAAGLGQLAAFRSLRTRRRLERSSQLPAPGALPASPPPPARCSPAYSGWFTLSLPPALFPPLPPPPIPPSSLRIRAAVAFRSTAGLEAEDVAAPGLGILISFLTSPLQKRFFCLTILSAPGFI